MGEFSIGAGVCEVADEAVEVAGAVIGELELHGKGLTE